MGKKKTVQTNDPWEPAQPYIIKSLEQTNAVFDESQPDLNAYAAEQRDAYGRLSPGAEAGIMGAQALTNDLIGGKYLTGNPYLQKIIDNTNAGVTGNVNAFFSASNRYGSGAHQGVLAKSIAENEAKLRYQDYDAERARQDNAVANAQSLMGGSQGLLNNAAELPWIGVGALAGNVRNASAGYGTSTTTTSNPMGAITGIGGLGLKAYSLSDERTKEKKRLIGRTADGLGIYSYEYVNDPTDTEQIGVMAQDVANRRPEAVGPVVDGKMTIDYSKLQDVPATTDTMPIVVPEWQNINANTPEIKPTLLDRFIDPDTSTTAGKLGVLGEYLMSADGSPFQALGQGLIGMRASDRERERQDAQDAATLEYRRAQLEKASQPDTSVVPGVGLVDQAGRVIVQEQSRRGEQERLFDRWQSMPEGPTKDMLARMLRGYEYTPDAILSQVQRAGQIAGAQAAARAPYKTASAASGRVQETKVIGGNTYRKINGRWYRG